MSRVTMKKYSTIDEWNTAFFPSYASKTRLANLEGNPTALAEALAEEAMKHATAQLSGVNKPKRTVGIHK